jgi:hypothetical protein
VVGYSEVPRYDHHWLCLVLILIHNYPQAREILEVARPKSQNGVVYPAHTVVFPAIGVVRSVFVSAMPIKPSATEAPLVLP